MSHPRLVLASASPRRRVQLAHLGLAPEVRPADVDESRLPDEGAIDYVARLAKEKARAVGRAAELVLAADTIVALGEELLGKPADPGEALAMLERLAGRRHRVLTGVALWDVDADRLAVEVSETVVTMRPYSSATAAWYVGTGEPMDKAGAYAIQERGALLVESIAGDYGTVVGLPLTRLPALFDAVGRDLLTTLEAG